MKSLRAFEIVQYVEKRKFCPLTELMTHFNVSQATIHRDIAALSASGQLRKVHGGVASLETVPQTENIPSHYRERIHLDMSAKEAIARKALKEISDGDIIFLDSSTTVYYLAKLLESASFANLTIITNSVLIIQEFPNFPANFFLIGLGGNYDLQLNAFLGQTSLAQVENLKIDKAFVSGVGITSKGVFSRHENHAFFLKKVLEISQCNFLLLGSSKFNRSGIFTIAPLTKFSRIISDKKLPSGF